MTTAIVVLLLVGLVLGISVLRPAGPFPSPADRDRERVLADLRAAQDHQAGREHS